MSEIVRPTRDGIHGREFISTAVDIGSKPLYLQLDSANQPIHTFPTTVSLPIPILFDIPPRSLEADHLLGSILNESAKRIQSYSIQSLASMPLDAAKDASVIPFVTTQDTHMLKELTGTPVLLEMASWDEQLFNFIRTKFPQTLPIVRTDYEGSDLLGMYKAGVRIFHLTTNYHGRSKSGRFVVDLIREAHLTFVKAGCREEVTLIGSGGVAVAEHLPKAILCGLDAVALDTPILVALQARFAGPCFERQDSHFVLPHHLNKAWGTQRLLNLANSWRDQLLEILGAMGLREVRRLRGEMGRAMFQKDLENDAFAEIPGYEHQ
jgi:hypothetical protein